MQPLGWASHCGNWKTEEPPQSQFAHSLTPHAYSRLDRASNQVSTLNIQITRHSILNQDRAIASLPTQARQAGARQWQKHEVVQDGMRAAEYILPLEGAWVDYWKMRATLSTFSASKARKPSVCDPVVAKPTSCAVAQEGVREGLL